MEVEGGVHVDEVVGEEGGGGEGFEDLGVDGTAEEGGVGGDGGGEEGGGGGGG